MEHIAWALFGVMTVIAVGYAAMNSGARRLLKLTELYADNLEQINSELRLERQRREQENEHEREWL